jgi:hypothetical protein
MRGHQHSEPFGGEMMYLAPEVAPRFGIDAGSRFIEQ